MHPVGPPDGAAVLAPMGIGGTGGADLDFGASVGTGLDVDEVAPPVVALIIGRSCSRALGMTESQIWRPSSS
jgi:hypothetical protein